MMSQEGNLTQGPEPVDTTDLHFKSLSKLKVLDRSQLSFDSNLNLLAVSQYYGLVFIGTNNSFLILKSKEVFSASTSNEYHQKEILLNCKTSHLAVNFEQKLLAVGCLAKMGPIVYIYDISSFLTKGVSPMKTVPFPKSLQDPVIQLCEVTWQPNNFNGLTICFSDGSVCSLSLSQATGNEIFSLPNTTQARCCCWSPKGKQLVIGCNDGTLSQYKPDLKFIKKLPAPPLFNGAVSVVNVLWISSFQFAAAYKEQHKPEEYPVIVIVNAQKNEPVKFINYDDITYSSSFFRNHQLYFCYQSAWNTIFVASANSIEVVVLRGKEDNSIWEQWLLGDASRAELPLNADKVETFPVGIAIDYTSDQTVPWGEDSLPPAPRLLLLSSEGLLTTFNVINICKGDPQLTHPPEETFEDSWFTVKEGNNDPLSLSKVNQPSLSTFVSQTSSLENVKPAQSLPSTSVFPPPVSTSLLTTKLFSSGSSVFTMQPSKEQVFSSQQVTPDRQPESVAQQPIHTSTVPISSYQNSSLKWSQNSPNLFSFNTVTSGGMQNNQTFADKNKETPKNFDQSSNVFISSTIAPKEPVKFMNMKENLKEPANIIKASETSDALKTSSSTVLICGQNTPLSTVPTMNVEQNLSNKKFEASPTRSSADLLAVSSKIYVTALMDEIDHFDAELKDVLSRVSALRVHIGTGEEKLDLRKSIEKLNDLEKGLHDNISGQKNEIYSIKSDVIEAFAWLEDARSRNRQRKNRTYIELKKSEDLDPMSSRVMSEISHLKYYIENQLKQLHSYLMREWMEHENNCRLDIKSMMMVPSTEELYKTMHLELKILNKLRATVEELRQRVTQKNMKIRSQTALNTESVDGYPKPVDDGSRMSELYKLADNLLQIKIDRDEPEDYINTTDAFQLMIKNQINEIAERSKKLTVFKQNILRDTFCEREMMKTRSVKSKFGTSSFIRNSSRIFTKYYNNLKDNDTEENIKSGSHEPEVEIDTSTPKLPQSTFQRQEKIIVPVKSNNDIKVDHKETSVTSETSTLVAVNRELSKLVSDVGSSLQEKLEIGKATELSVTGQSAAGDTTSSVIEISKSELKTAPFVFNAAPFFSFGISGFQSPNAPAISSGLGSSTGNMQTSSVPPASNTTSVFAFKAADATSATPATNSFSFPTVKTSSFAPKAYTPFSSSVPDTPANTSESSSPSSSDIKVSAVTSTPTPVFSFSSNTSSAPNSSTVTTTSVPVFKFTTSSTSSSSSIFKFTTSASSFSFPSPFNSSKTSTGGTTFSFTSPTISTAFVSTTASDISPSTNSVNVLSQPNLTFKGIAEANKEVNAEKTGTRFGLSELESGLSLTITTTATTTTTNVTTSTVSNVTHANAAVIASHDSPISEGKDESETKKCEAKEDEEQNSEGKPNLTVPKTESSDPEKTEASSIALPESVQQSTSTVFTQSTVVSSTAATASFSSTPSTSTLSFGVPGKSIFSQSMPISTTSSIFSSTKPITSNAELFKATSPTSASSSNIFGLSSTVSTTAGSSPFSQTVATTSSTTSFVQPSKDELGQTANLFSDMLRSGLSSANVFETSSANTSGNIFDKSGSSIFGTARTTVTSATATTGLFESTPVNIFMKSSFGQIPSSSSSNFFAQPQRENTTFFGQNICSSFGSTTTTAPNQSPFASGFNSRPVFGQSLFGQSNAGQNPLERSSTTNIFGSSSSASSGGNLFQMGSSSFSNTTPTPFSSGQSTSATSAFQKPMGGFGGSPVFGSGLATTGTFGAPPTFGGSSTFGSPPSFGSSQKIFGSPQGTFGQNQSNFESLANESTVGFADLAQRNQNQTFGSNTFNQSATFESESSFGGKSFSSWRS